MSDYAGSDELLERVGGFIQNHGLQYAQSGGVQGHIIQIPNYNLYLPTLLLKTKGRRSGRQFTSPLVYGFFGGEWVVIGSKGGASDHPAWYLNLIEQDSAYVQIATQAFLVRWRLAEGAEREAVWDYMVRCFAPFASYKEGAGDRVIPVVMLTLVEELASLADLPGA